jgi:hypothetical protein
MNTDHHTKTAQILAFPVRGRMKSAIGPSEQELARMKNYVDCSSWYHQEAIDDSSSATTPSGPRRIS